MTTLIFLGPLLIRGPSLDLGLRPGLRPTQPPIQWVPGVLSPGAKRGQGVTLTTHLHLVLSSRMSRSYNPLLPVAYMAVAGQIFYFYFLFNDAFSIIQTICHGK
jgi:hypothetical protein